MKRTKKPAKTPAEWDANDLYKKSERYVQRMQGSDVDDWEYALWSSFSLEFLARAALANVSPALLAESGWNNLYHSLGFTPSESKFTPKSIAISEVWDRIGSIFSEFTDELKKFSDRHTKLRNAELHTGKLAFEEIKSSAWEPDFYKTCTILLSSMGKTLEDFLGVDKAKIAKKIIEAASDKSAKAARDDVAGHKKYWEAMDEEERNIKLEQAKLWAVEYRGHRVKCPACASAALVYGESVSTPKKKMDGDLIIETRDYLPNRFECIACSLKISGLSRLTAVKLGDRYKKTQDYDAAEYYAPEEYEPDYNE